jgi:hypothetical protein
MLWLRLSVIVQASLSPQSFVMNGAKAAFTVAPPLIAAVPPQARDNIHGAVRHKLASRQVGMVLGAEERRWPLL